MLIVAIASQKGGAGKSTLAANLSVLADREDAPSLLVDTDPHAALAGWHRARARPTPLLVPCRAPELSGVLESARRQANIEWAFVDVAAPTVGEVALAMQMATLILIPTRPGMFDLAAVPNTIAAARRLRRPFFVTLNGVPPKHGTVDSPIVGAARKAIRDMGAPVWRGAIAQRAVYARAFAGGQAVTELEVAGPAGEEMRQLWRDVSEAARAMAQYEQVV